MILDYLTGYSSRGSAESLENQSAQATEELSEGLIPAGVNQLLEDRTVYTFEGVATAETYARDGEEWYEHEADMSQDDERSFSDDDEEVSWREGISMLKNALF
jgi:hypothetical protein